LTKKRVYIGFSPLKSTGMGSFGLYGDRNDLLILEEYSIGHQRGVKGLELLEKYNVAVGYKVRR
jgi:hypothetical protein